MQYDSSMSDQSVIDQRIARQVGFILSQQRASGAIQHGSGGINPYFGNFAALGLLEEGSPEAVVAADRWHDWVYDHLNRTTDVQGIRYTIYDYKIVNGAEVSEQKYDSVDSYTATNIMVAAELWECGDSETREKIASRITTYEQMANLLNYSPPTGLRKPSGLTQATPQWNLGYAMDNSEVSRGLQDLVRLETHLGRTSAATYYGNWAATTKRAILSTVWNDTNQTWNFHDSTPSTLMSFYNGGGSAQYFPLINHVVDADDPRAVSSWRAITTRWPDWSTNKLGMASTVTPMAYAAALMGDTDGGQTMLDDIHARYAPEWHFPSSCDADDCNAYGWWSASQAGWYIRALKALD